MSQKSSVITHRLKAVAYLSTYPPRECGIATFTKDLVNSINALHEFKSQTVIAINEKETIYNYDKRVKKKNGEKSLRVQQKIRLVKCSKEIR